MTPGTDQAAAVNFWSNPLDFLRNAFGTTMTPAQIAAINVQAATDRVNASGGTLSYADALAQAQSDTRNIYASYPDTGPSSLVPDLGSLPDFNTLFTYVAVGGLIIGGLLLFSAARK